MVEGNPDIHLLLADDITTVEDPKKDQYPPNIYYNSFLVSWSHQFDGDIQWYSSLGHSTKAYAVPLYQKHLKGDIQYILSFEN